MGRRESNSPYWSGSRSWRHGCALPRVHPVRDAGGWAAPRKRRGAITPTPRQPGIEAAARLASSRWGWVGWLKRGFAIDMECGPRAPPGAWRLIAALTRRPVIFRILASPPGSSPAGRCPTAPGPGARLGQGHFTWTLCKRRVRTGCSGRQLGRGASARSDPVAPRAMAGDPRQARGAEGASSEPTRGGSKR
jgi:hypothetical protein